MKNKLYIVFILLFIFALKIKAQTSSSNTTTMYKVPVIVYKGDSIPCITLRTVYVYPELHFKKIETYEYLMTLPDEKARNQHIKLVEKGLKEQYTPRMKKLTFAQGKLLIKLVNRECNQSSFQLVKAFMGPFKAGFYQTFAALFGASLKKEYHPEDEDKLTERVVTLVENGQL